MTYSVEKLRFTMTGKFVRIFRSWDAHITVAFSASEALLSGFSCAIYHPLISRVRKWAQIANEITSILKTEFFNRIDPKQTLGGWSISACLPSRDARDDNKEKNMSSSCSHCGGTGKISSLRVPESRRHNSAGAGMERCFVCGGSGQLGFDVAGPRKAGESLGELIGEYLPIFVFIFFSANYIPRLIQSYFGLSADVYRNITVVGVLLLIPIFIFRRRLTGRAGWIGAGVLIAAAIFSPDIVTPEEKAQMAAFEEFRPLLRAAQGLGTCTQDIINMKKSGTPNNLEEMVIHCDAMKANFTELAESSPDELVAKLCAPPYSGASTKTLHRERSPDVDNFCKSRNL